MQLTRGLATLTSILQTLVLLYPAHGQVPTLLETHGEENRDGRVEDIAGPSSVTSAGTSTSRVWLAQGRVRVALRVSDRARQFSEDATFNSSLHPDNFERIMAVEVDESNQYLYTLTERALYREDITIPSQPSNRVVLDLCALAPAPSITNIEVCQDLKIWSPARKVFILTQKRIIIVDSGRFGLAWISATGLDPNSSASAFPESSCPAGMAALDVRALRRLRVMQDNNGRVIGYVTADALGYPSNGRPPARIVMACDLSDGNWLSPTFDADPGAGQQAVNYVYWNPMPVPPGSSMPLGTEIEDYTINSLDTYAAGNERFVYVACGKINQVQRLQVTDAFPKSCPSSGYITAVTSVTVSGNDHILNVLADRNAVPRFFAVGATGFFIRDFNPTWTGVTINEAFGHGCPRDFIHLTIIGEFEPYLQTAWTVEKGLGDHVCKEMNVTFNTHPVPVLDEWFAISSSDGGVALNNGPIVNGQNSTNVYIPTWTGVVRYEQIAGPAWRAVPDSYQPSEVTSPAWKVYPTEHIEVAKLGDVDRLFTASADGGFMEFRIDTATNPSGAVHSSPSLIPPGWSSSELWGNDVHFLDLEPSHATHNKFLLVDLARMSSQPLGDTGHEVALLAYKWDYLSNGWSNVAVKAGQLTLHQVPPVLTDTITVSQVNGKAFAFVGHSRGFLSSEVTDLALATPQIWLRSEVYAVGGTPTAYLPCPALTCAGDKLFVYLHQPTPFIRIYSWNQLTGVVDATNTQDIVLPQDYGFGYRARFDVKVPATGEGNAYFACNPYLLQMKWLPGLGTPPGPGSLTLTGYWKSDYALPIQDCRIYTLPSLSGAPRGILTVKDTEAFAFVKEN